MFEAQVGHLSDALLVTAWHKKFPDNLNCNFFLR